jgi:hypothetical protein
LRWPGETDYEQPDSEECCRSGEGE